MDARMGIYDKKRQFLFLINMEKKNVEPRKERKNYRNYQSQNLVGRKQRFDFGE